MGRRVANRAAAWAAVALAVTVALAGCASTRADDPTSPPAPTSTRTSPPPLTVTAAQSTLTVTQAPSTVTTSLGPSQIQPPAATPEPDPQRADCPYLTNAQVKDANGQGTGATSIVDTKPYPVCIFTRSDGNYLATTRIIVADTPEEAVAAVNQHVPVDHSNPATHPAGWSGGSMGNLHGVEGYPAAKSIYAVSKGTIAIVAISNQAQSIKGRQMVQDIVENLGL